MNFFLTVSALIIFLSPLITTAQVSNTHNLQSDHLAVRWDEAMPLGNGMLGALLWEKDNKLRLSLDRADLWDERKAMDLSKFNFHFVVDHVKKQDYDTVHTLGDAPYDDIPYPTKLPAAAIEFNISLLGKVISNVLDIKTALNTVKFESGIVFHCYIHATQQDGFFSFENVTDTNTSRVMSAITPELIIHNYNSGKNKSENDNSHSGEGLEKLGYAKGTVIQTTNSIHYHQPTYNNHYYEVLVKWKRVNKSTIIGSWTITNNEEAHLPEIKSNTATAAGWNVHVKWWNNFWSKSSVSLPDSLLEKQYFLEQYKLGCVARKGAPAITLQAVWTADNGSLPPWKGDFHNDLNTQLSYWSSYTGNHLAEAETYTDWLWKIKERNEQYTKQYFGVSGLNVPGVVTVNGDPMGGWIQYSLSPTVVAWCAQHFYWQWKYSMDTGFLTQKAYPYIHEAAIYLENITQLKEGKRYLPLSSSPEYNDNNIIAWFTNWSNFDLSLSKFLFTAAIEVSKAKGKLKEADHWKEMLDELPSYEVNETGFTVAPGQNLNESHRHMSPYMAIYPLALLDINKPDDKTIIQNSFNRIKEKGTMAWCGYSFAWMACLYARAYEADSAVKHLQIFASHFCSPNSFHLNGDQKGGQYSGFTYRPFTLEGNFAFAQGVHELLLQSRNGYMQIFPAVPSSWQNVSFKTLRAEGSFLVSAEKKKGKATNVFINSEQGGLLRLKLPFAHFIISGNQKKYEIKDGIVEVNMNKGEEIIFLNND